MRKEKLNGRFSVLGRKKDTQSSDGSDESARMESGSLTGAKETGRLSRIDGKMSAFRENEDDQAVNGNKLNGSAKKTVGKADHNKSTGQNVRDIGQAGVGVGGKIPTSETELAQSINHLSESLKQIAASREQPSEMLKIQKGWT